MRRLILALLFACSGIRYVFRYERNFRLEVYCALFSITGAYFLKVSATELLIIFLNIGVVLSAEIFNTAVEKFCDLVCKEINPAVKIVKDTAAAAVLVSVAGAAVCGAFIFIPKILHFIRISQ